MRFERRPQRQPVRRRDPTLRPLRRGKRLRAENATLRDLLAKALPWIDPNDTHEDFLLTVAIREALVEGS